MHKCIKLLSFVSLLSIPLCAISAPLPSSQQWITDLISDLRRRVKMEEEKTSQKNQDEILASIKKSFAIAHMAASAYGKKLQKIKPDQHQTYFSLVDSFFEKAVIKALFKQKGSKTQDITHRVYPSAVYSSKIRKDSECATSLVGTVAHEHRVDWTVGSGEDREEYETRFCLRKTDGSDFEIVDVVVEGISWVQDLADEITRFYTETPESGTPNPPEAIHAKLLTKLRQEIAKLEEKKPEAAHAKK